MRPLACAVPWMIMVSLAAHSVSASTYSAFVDWEDEVENFHGVDMVATSEGGVVVTGTLSERRFETAIMTIRYDAEGYIDWDAVYSPSTGTMHRAQAIAISEPGEITVTGASRLGSVYGFVTIRYGSDGRERWVARFDAESGGESWPQDVVVDSSGNVTVVGTTYNGTDNDAIIIRYSDDGAEIWRHVIDRGGNENVAFFQQSVVVDGDGVATVIGSFGVQAFDLTGGILWSAPGNDSAVVQDELGRIVTTSHHSTRCFAEDGTLLWSATDGGTHIAAGPDGHVWTTSAHITGSEWDYMTARFSDEGEILWTAYYDGGGFDMPMAIVVDSESNAYVTGRSDSRKGLLRLFSQDFLTVRYDESGEEEWTERRLEGAGEAVALDGVDGVFVTGFHGYTVRYKQPIQRGLSCSILDIPCFIFRWFDRLTHE